MSELTGQRVGVIGGSSGSGLESARLARAKGADMIVTARNPDQLARGRRRARRAPHDEYRGH
jgi:NAD(P)-dependent dehydrogenase (short-subunit alcohol dehydrogenase family)